MLDDTHPCEVDVLTREEGRRLFDRAAWEELGISGDEFLRRYDAGHYNGDDADPDVIGLIMLIPFARPGLRPEGE